MPRKNPLHVLIRLNNPAAQCSGCRLHSSPDITHFLPCRLSFSHPRLPTNPGVHRLTAPRATVGLQRHVSHTYPSLKHGAFSGSSPVDHYFHQCVANPILAPIPPPYNLAIPYTCVLHGAERSSDSVVQDCSCKAHRYNEYPRPGGSSFWAQF
jgi:hypothetical protein